MTATHPIDTQPSSENNDKNMLPGMHNNQSQASPGQVILKSGNEYPNQWSKGLFECWKSEDCCFAFFCFQWYHCGTVGYKFGDSCLSAWLCVPPPRYSSIYRNVKKIQGSHCTDTLKYAVCPCCSHIQLMEEIKERGTIFQN